VSPSPLGKHAAGSPATDRQQVPEPSFAERARTLAYLGRVASLSTLSRKQPGFPSAPLCPTPQMSADAPFPSLAPWPCTPTGGNAVREVVITPSMQCRSICDQSRWYVLRRQEHGVPDCVPRLFIIRRWSVALDCSPYLRPELPGRTSPSGKLASYG
jgi:hypothetical protein